MQMAMPEAQDISQETEATRKLYGLDHPVTETLEKVPMFAGPTFCRTRGALHPSHAQRR